MVISAPAELVLRAGALFVQEAISVTKPEDGRLFLSCNNRSASTFRSGVGFRARLA